MKLNNLLVLNQKGKQVTGIKKQQKTRQRPDLFLNLLFPDFSVTVKDTLPLEPLKADAEISGQIKSFAEKKPGKAVAKTVSQSKTQPVTVGEAGEAKKSVPSINLTKESKLPPGLQVNATGTSEYKITFGEIKHRIKTILGELGIDNIKTPYREGNQPLSVREVTEKAANNFLEKQNHPAEEGQKLKYPYKPDQIQEAVTETLERLGVKIKVADFINRDFHPKQAVEINRAELNIRQIDTFELRERVFPPEVEYRQSLSSSEIRTENINPVTAKSKKLELEPKQPNPLFHQLEADSKGQNVRIADLDRVIFKVLQEPENSNLRQLEIKLEPESLGKLNIRIIDRQEKVDIVIRAQMQHTNEMLKNDVDTLRDNLLSRGLEAGQISINLEDFSRHSGANANLNHYVTPKGGKEYIKEPDMENGLQRQVLQEGVLGDNSYYINMLI